MGRKHIQSKQHSPPDTPKEEIHQINHEYKMNRHIYILGPCITIASIGYAIHLGWDVVDPSVLCQLIAQPADWVVHLLPGVVGFPIERGQQDVVHRGASRRSAQQEEARKTCHGRMLQWGRQRGYSVPLEPGEKKNVATPWCWHSDLHLGSSCLAHPDCIWKT